MLNTVWRESRNIPSAINYDCYPYHLNPTTNLPYICAGLLQVMEIHNPFWPDLLLPIHNVDVAYKVWLANPRAWGQKVANLTWDYDPNDPSGSKIRDAFMEDSAARYLAALGIGKSFLDTSLRSVNSQLKGSQYLPNIKPSYSKPINGMIMGTPSSKGQVQLSANYNEHALIHEYAHSFQDNLSDEEKAELKKIISEFPPDQGSSLGGAYPGYGFTGISTFGNQQGAPTIHHNPSGDWGLADYFDYSMGGFQPDTQRFRSDVDKPWERIPEPILDFIRKKHPYTKPKDIYDTEEFKTMIP